MTLLLTLPTSHQDRLNTLKRIHLVATREGGDSEYLSDEIVSEVSEMVTLYEDALQNLNNAKAIERALREELEPKFLRLQAVIRSAWTALRKRNILEGLPSSVLDLYGLPRTRNPDINSVQEWMDAGTKLVSGDAEAVAESYPAMVYPTAAMVQEAMEGVLEGSVEVDSAVLLCQRERAELMLVSKESRLLLRKCAALLKVRLIDSSAPSRRAAMRRFGFRFKGEPNNPETDETNGTEPDPLEEPGSKPSGQGPHSQQSHNSEVNNRVA